MTTLRYTTRGRFLRDARTRNGQTQRWVAGAAKVAERTVLRAEKGGDVSPENILSICAALRIERNDLPGMDETPTAAGPVDVPARGSGRRRLLAHAALAILMVCSTSGVYLAASASEVDRDTRLMQDVVRSAHVAVAGRSLATLGYLHAGSELTRGKADDLAGEIGINYDRCDLGTWADFVLMRGCRIDAAGVRIVDLDGTVLTLAVGPLTRKVHEALANQLPLDGRMDLRLARSKSPDASPDTLIWTDPLGRRAAGIANFDDGDWFMIEMRRKGDAS